MCSNTDNNVVIVLIVNYFISLAVLHVWRTLDRSTYYTRTSDFCFVLLRFYSLFFPVQSVFRSVLLNSHGDSTCIVRNDRFLKRERPVPCFSRLGVSCGMRAAHAILFGIIEKIVSSRTREIHFNQHQRTRRSSRSTCSVTAKQSFGRWFCRPLGSRLFWSNFELRRKKTSAPEYRIREK